MEKTDDIYDAVAGLLDLGIGNVKDKYYLEQEHHIPHFINASQLEISETNNSSNFSDDDSINGSYVTPDDVYYSSDDDSLDSNPDDRYIITIETKREIGKPEQNMYVKTLFVSGVEIQTTLSIVKTKLTSFNRISQSRHKMNVIFQGIVSKHDAKPNAIRISHNHIQNGDLSVQSLSRDNPIIVDDIIPYNKVHTNVSISFDQCWGRRPLNKIGDTSKDSSDDDV